MNIYIIKCILYKIFFFTLLFNIGCQSKFEVKNSNIVWFGGHIIEDPLDKNSINVGLNYIEVLNDSLLLLYYENRIVDSLQNTRSNNEFSIKNDVLTIYDNYRFTAAINYNSEATYDFKNKNWKNQKYEVFLSDSTMLLRNIKSDKIIQKCYKVEKFNEFNFIRTFGSKLECNENVWYFQYQLLQINDKTLILKGFLDGEYKTIKLKESDKVIDNESNNITSNESNFNLCNDLLNNNYPSHRYYGAKVKYIGGIYNISKKFKEKYRKPNDILESGLIRVNFIVNCKGETGMFEILELDENYKQKRFNKQISDQILSICKELDEWIPGIVEGQKVDSYKFLTFKIKNSEIVEIFP